MVNRELKNYGVLNVFFGVLTQRHFDVSPIWCECHDSSELNDIDDVPTSWIEENLIIPMAATTTRPFYAVNKDIDYSRRDYICILSNLQLGGLTLLGYVFLVKGKANSVTIFINEKRLDIYSSTLRSADNTGSVTQLCEYCGVDSIGDNKIFYSIVPERLSGIYPEGVLVFPVG